MKTIDDLKFPHMDQPAKLVILKSNLLLPSGILILAGKEIELSHTGIHAIVKVGNEEYKF